MAISVGGIDNLLNAYNKQMRMKRAPVESPKDKDQQKPQSVQDEVTLSKQWVAESEAPNKIPQKLIEDLLKSEKK